MKVVELRNRMAYWPSSCETLRNGHDGMLNMTLTELISAPASWTQCVFQRFQISLRNFNQLDATSKVMYRHEIICAGNKDEFN